MDAKRPVGDASGGGLVHPTGYRADIDGLRALSVVSVILFHLSPNHFRAGGIGVDVFFVISGYLIGGIVLASFDRGSFSFAEFYLRRIRRIIPAFLAMVLATTIVGLFRLFPGELIGLASSGIAALFCASNILFYFTADYFGPRNIDIPLLHTWTLAVEEQFYFAVPLLALAIHRLGQRRHMLSILWLVGVLSFLISLWQVGADPPAAFYLLPSRAWELMLGVIASRLAIGCLRQRAWRELASLIGIGAIFGALLLLDPARGFPGWRAIAPCFGAALLLVAGGQGPTMVGRLLAIPPARLIGLASYSLYLWHWPVIVFFMRVQMIGKLHPLQIIEALALSFVAGFLSWRFIERPFRRKEMGNRRLLWLTGTAAASVLAIQIAIIAWQGFPDRIPAQARKIAAYEQNKAKFSVPAEHCFLTFADGFADYDQKKCLTPVAGRANWLLVGDSHAAMLHGALVASFPDVHFLSAIAYGCDVHVGARSDYPNCHGLMRHIFTDYLPRARIDGVILTSRWEVLEPEAITRLSAMLAARGIKLMLIGPAPEYSLPVARVLAESAWRGDPGLPRRLLEPMLWSVDDRLRALSKSAGFLYLSPMRAMCAESVNCLLSDAQGLPLYSDGTHYNSEGARTLFQRLKAIDPKEGAPLGHGLAATPASIEPSVRPITAAGLKSY